MIFSFIRTMAILWFVGMLLLLGSAAIGRGIAPSQVLTFYTLDVASGSNGPYALDLQTGVYTLIAHTEGTPSPDGRYRVRCRWAYETGRCLNLILSDAQGNEQTIQGDGTQIIRSHFWMPDSQRLAYTTLSRDIAQIHVHLMDIGTGVTQGLQIFESTDAVFSVPSPNREWLALWNGVSAPANLHLLNLEDGRLQTYDNLTHIWKLRWSPDSQAIMLQTNDPYESRDLIRLDLSSAQRRAIGRYCIEDFVWSPDGQSLLAEACRDGRRVIQRIDATTGDTDLRYDWKARSGLSDLVRWSGDGRWAALASPDDSFLRLMPMQGDDAPLFLPIAGKPAHLLWLGSQQLLLGLEDATKRTRFYLVDVRSRSINLLAQIPTKGHSLRLIEYQGFSGQ